MSNEDKHKIAVDYMSALYPQVHWGQKEGETPEQATRRRSSELRSPSAPCGTTDAPVL